MHYSTKRVNDIKRSCEREIKEDKKKAKENHEYQRRLTLITASPGKKKKSDALNDKSDLKPSL